MKRNCLQLSPIVSNDESETRCFVSDCLLPLYGGDRRQPEPRDWQGDAWALTVLLLADPTVARALLDALRRWPADRTTRHLIRSISDSQREDDL